MSQSGGVIVPETTCDGLDNDCNGIVDDHQPNKGQACDDGNKGECKSTGTYICDAAHPTGAAVCNYTQLGGTPLPESCNNKDDDCDGVIDNVSAAGTFPGGGLEWVNIGGGHQMMKYEASKPDATGTDSGQVVTVSCGGTSTVATISESGTIATITTSTAHNLAVGRVVAIAGSSVAGYNTTFVVATVPSATTFTMAAPSGLGSATGGTATPQCPTCSQATVVPWTNVRYGQAVAACKAVGANLCSDVQWHRACSVVDSTTWPVTLPGTGNVNTTIEAEDYAGIAVATDASNSVTHSWTEDYTLGYSGIGAMFAGPDVGSSLANGAATTDGPRLDYTFNFTKATSNYHLWVLLYSANSNANRVAVTVDGATVTANNQYTSTGSNGSWQWVERSAGTYTITAGLHTIHVFMMRDGVRVDAIAIRDGTTAAPALPANGPGNLWAYAATPNTYQATTCNGHDYDAATDSTLTTGFLASCYANDAGFVGSSVADHAFDMSGNVKEWTLAHQPGQNPIRGGASNNTDVGISCALELHAR